MRPLARALLAAAALAAVALLPAPAAASADYTFHGPAGTPENPQCAPDNNYEYTHAEGDTMFVPHRGCTVSYSPTAAGATRSQHIAVTSIHYRVTGHVGTICGHFQFSGRVTGQSASTCTPHDSFVTASVSTQPAGDDEFVVVTWMPETSYDNAYLYSFGAEQQAAPGGDPPPPPPPPQPCLFGHGGGCVVPDPVCRQVDCLVQAALRACDEALPDPEGRYPPPPVPSDCEPPCVSGTAEDCIAGPVCLVGSQASDEDDHCLVQKDPGCTSACETVRDTARLAGNAVCGLFGPAGLATSVAEFAIETATGRPTEVQTWCLLPLGDVVSGF